jgi:putative transposase
LTDSLVDGRCFRVFTILDNVSRGSPAIVVDFPLKGTQVVAVLEQLKRPAGLPQRIAVDKGPEFISKALDAWTYRNRVTLEFLRPGKPTDNAYVESFNGHFREECLNQHWFETLAEAREAIEGWWVEYNTERPHRALGQQAPAAAQADWALLNKAAD